MSQEEEPLTSLDSGPNEVPIRNLDSFAGKFCFYWIRMRCVWTLPAIIVTIVLLAFFLRSSMSFDDPKAQPIVLKSIPFQNLDNLSSSQPTLSYTDHQLTITGDLKSKDLHRKIYNFSETYSIITNNHTEVKSLTISRVLIDSVTLTQFLLKYSSTIESIKLDQVWLYNFNFTPINLPQLKSFSLNFYRNHKTDFYKNATILQSIFFFLPQSVNFTTNFLSYASKFTTIHFSLDGTTIINIEPGNVVLNLPYCGDLFQNFDSDSVPPLSLSLSWCKNFNLTNLQRYNTSIKYLNLNTVSTPMQDLKEFKNLETLIIFHNSKEKLNKSNDNIILDLNFLTSNLKKLAVGNVQLNYGTNNIFPNLIELSIENVNLPLGNILSLFPNLESLYISNMNIGLETITKNYGTKLKFAFVQNNRHGENLIIDFTDKNQIETRSMTSYEINYLRYKYLGFYAIDSYEDYVIWDAL